MLDKAAGLELPKTISGFFIKNLAEDRNIEPSYFIGVQSVNIR